MGKSSFFLVAVFVAAFAMLFPKAGNAQKYQGQVVMTAGVGYSLTGILFSAIQEGLNTSGEVKSTKTPVLAGALDYGITDRFSLGALYTYQGLNAKYSGFETIDSNGDTVITTGDFSDRLTRQSIGIRPLFHVGDNDDLDTYFGFRFNYVFWNYSTSRTDVSSSELFKSFGSPVKVQVLFGMRYFFTDNIGLNAEFAVGPTYFMMFGLNARFGGM